MQASWDALRPELLALLMARISLEDVASTHGLQACVHALRWCVRSGASESLALDWFAQGALSEDLALRQVTCQVLRECDLELVARLVRHFKHVHHKLPRSFRTAIIKLLRRLEADRDADLLITLHYDALRYVYATLHIKPSVMMQRLLFESRRSGRSALAGAPKRGFWHAGSTPRERHVVQVYVESTRYVSQAMLDAVEYLVCDIARRDVFFCELFVVSEGVRRCYPATPGVEGWQDAVRHISPCGDVGDLQALERMIVHQRAYASGMVGHILYVADGRRIDHERALGLAERVVSHGDDYGVSVVRWGARGEAKEFVFDRARVSVWCCPESRCEQLADTMSYMLI